MKTFKNIIKVIIKSMNYSMKLQNCFKDISDSLDTSGYKL